MFAEVQLRIINYEIKEFMPLVRLFTSGTHNKMDFSNEDIANIYAKTQASALSKIPFVLGHPKNDLPIVGWLQKSAIQHYKEGDKMSIGFDKGSAEFSQESMDVLRNMKRNKISVRLQDYAIVHAGLVERAAVSENNQQDFEATDKGNGCFGDEDFSAEDSNGLWGKIEGYVKGLFDNNKKQEGTMTPEEKAAHDAELKAKDDALAKEKADKEAAEKKVAEFEAKEKVSKKDALKAKVDALKFDEEKSKQAMEFGEAMIDAGKHEAFADFLAGLTSGKSVTVVNGSVVGGTKDFSEKKESAEEAIRKQFENLNKK